MPPGIMLDCIIMRFVDRTEELDRLEHLLAREEGALAVVYGRRRIGKTRLLLEWLGNRAGVYTVADLSTADLQRRYVAEALATRLPGFGDVEYRDWPSLLVRLAREAQVAGLRGPFIFDELPYLVLASPELPSVLQRWIDHEAQAARLVVAVAGSSQRMMQGFVLARDAPLFGRAREILELGPLDPSYLREVFRVASGIGLAEAYAAWGGVPRYWELAVQVAGDPPAQIERLVLDPLGPLHREPDRLLVEEVPSAVEARPVLDAIGAGAHRVSEIAGRIGRPATSMARPLDRLVEMGVVRREIPFREPEKRSRRSLYKIDDPFFRLWPGSSLPTGASSRPALAASACRSSSASGRSFVPKPGRSCAASGFPGSIPRPPWAGWDPGGLHRAGGREGCRSGTWWPSRSTGSFSCSARPDGAPSRWRRTPWSGPAGSWLQSPRRPWRPASPATDRCARSSCPSWPGAPARRDARRRNRSSSRPGSCWGRRTPERRRQERHRGAGWRPYVASGYLSEEIIPEVPWTTIQRLPAF